MPIYTFRNVLDNEEYTMTMSIAEMERFTEDNKESMVRVLKPIPQGDPVRLGVHKQPNGWNDLVKEVKKKNFGSNINHKNGEM